LTEDIWRELRTVETKYGGRLANCITAGVNNPLLPVGVYACDDDAYVKFSKVFDPIIQHLHGYDVSSGTLIKHNVDIKSLNWKKLEKGMHCIKFIQVHASRNIDGFPFVPILDSRSKSEIENKLKKIVMVECNSKIALNSMTELDRKKFTDEGLLFDRHPSLDDIITTLKANEGCSIYHNTDLTQVAWINADDHIQYFVIHRTEPDLYKACTKLFFRLRALESNIPMHHDKSLGYLTCNPENIGTALKIKVVVQLQRLAGEKVNIQALNTFCKQYGVLINVKFNTVYEVLLVKSFQVGKTESDIIGGLIDCIHELLKYEEMAMSSKEDQKEIPKFDEMNTSLIMPFMTEEIWKKYGGIATSFEYTLKDCIRPGLANHKIGLIAVDAECYNVFKELFMGVVQVYHEDYKKVDFKFVPDSLEEFVNTLQKFKPLKHLVDGYLIWQGNIADKVFPCGFNKKSREEVNTYLLNLLDPLIKYYNLSSTNIEDTSLYLKDLTVEKNKLAELITDWPEYRSHFKDTTGNINILTNIMNHITIAITLNKDLIESIKTYFEIVNELVLKHFKLWAFSDTFGFFETLPTDIGNGFSIKMGLRLPKVIDMDSYMVLPVSKNVNLDEKIIYLTHKHKFESPSQCILELIETANIIERRELLEDMFTTELIREFENVKTIKGLICDDILKTADPNYKSTLLIEGLESLVIFGKLYAHALNKSSNATFDFLAFSYNLTESVLTPIELPVIPAECIGKSIELSRNFLGFPFPGFMKEEERDNLIKTLIPILTALDVT
jgi:protein-arginine kinase